MKMFYTPKDYNKLIKEYEAQKFESIVYEDLIKEINAAISKGALKKQHPVIDVSKYEHKDVLLKLIRKSGWYVSSMVDRDRKESWVLHKYHPLFRRFSTYYFLWTVICFIIGFVQEPNVLGYAFGWACLYNILGVCAALCAALCAVFIIVCVLEHYGYKYD